MQLFKRRTLGYQDRLVVPTNKNMYYNSPEKVLAALVIAIYVLFDKTSEATRSVILPRFQSPHTARTHECHRVFNFSCNVKVVTIPWKVAWPR
jgi:hypothetical protein